MRVFYSGLKVLLPENLDAMVLNLFLFCLKGMDLSSSRHCWINFTRLLFFDTVICKKNLKKITSSKCFNGKIMPDFFFPNQKSGIFE